MRIDTPTIVALSLCEVVALVAIVHLWIRRRRTRLITRLLWSVVLLVPLFGVLFYGLTRSDPEAHSDGVPESTYGTDPGPH
jgi:hypothetical protein